MAESIHVDIVSAEGEIFSGPAKMVFLPRHGRGHPLSPTRLNYRANIDALKRSGVTDVLSLSAVPLSPPETTDFCFLTCDRKSK